MILTKQQADDIAVAALFLKASGQYSIHVRIQADGPTWLHVKEWTTGEVRVWRGKTNGVYLGHYTECEMYRDWDDFKRTYLTEA